ncbi:hypothetical protein L208DRAFT_1410139 [Tricholoma matsutake]|nr:hypothetical protein L208DRAFT_1410139 [Tricholoma matsutake 945]
MWGQPGESCLSSCPCHPGCRAFVVAVLVIAVLGVVSVLLLVTVPFLVIVAILVISCCVVVAVIAIPPAIHPMSSGSWGWRWVVCCWSSIVVGGHALPSWGSGAGRRWRCHCRQLHTLMIHPTSRGSQAWGGCVGLSRVWLSLPVE